VAGLALGEVPPMLGRGLHDPAQQAEEALRSLGYAPALAQRAARQALDQLGADAGLEAIIKLALKSL
jgi:Holliday junction resolvasome RuvABC DNA-binding subunit